MKNRDKIKFILVFVTVFYTLVALVYIYFDNKLKDRRDFELNDKLLYNYSKTERDLCDTSIFGEAQQSKDKVMNINFYCRKDKYKTNSFSLDAVKQASAGEVINEVTRIVRAKLPEDWSCYYEKMPIQDKKQIVLAGKTIDCLAPGLTINDIYPNK